MREPRHTRLLGMVVLISAVFLTDNQPAESGERTVRYPRVFGFTGRPYGPTQAHYQYQRQYGRPWHGYGGNTVRVSGHHHGHAHFSGGYAGCQPAVFGSYGTYGYGLGYGSYYGGISPWGGFTSVNQVTSFNTFGPTMQFYGGVGVGYPGVLPNWQPPGINTAALDDIQAENAQRWHGPLDLTPGPRVVPIIVKSSAQARLRSLELQGRGDTSFRKQDYSRAYLHYKTAVALAGDLASARFRLAAALIAIGQFESAADELRKAIDRDPQWPLRADYSLAALYGSENEIAMTSHLQRIMDWTREDIRDPERLFLLGSMLYQFEKTEEAAVCFETGLRLAGRGEHFKHFLRAARPQATAPVSPPVGNPGRPATIEPQVNPPDKPIIPPLPAAAVQQAPPVRQAATLPQAAQVLRQQ